MLICYYSVYCVVVSDICGVQIVCDCATGKRKSTQLEIAANATCREVIRLAMQTFDMLSTEDCDDYSLIQYDRITKG